eukprot:2522629-Amphidinium_carterae.1
MALLRHECGRCMDHILVSRTAGRSSSDSGGGRKTRLKRTCTLSRFHFLPSQNGKTKKTAERGGGGKQGIGQKISNWNVSCTVLRDLFRDKAFCSYQTSGLLSAQRMVACALAAVLRKREGATTKSKAPDHTGINAFWKLGEAFGITTCYAGHRAAKANETGESDELGTYAPAL